MNSIQLKNLFSISAPIILSLGVVGCDSQYNTMNEETITKIGNLEERLTYLEEQVLQKTLKPCFVKIETVFDSYPQKALAQGQLNTLITKANLELKPQKDEMAQKEKEILELREKLSGFVEAAKESKKQEVNPEAVKAKESLLELAQEFDTLCLLYTSDAADD